MDTAILAIGAALAIGLSAIGTGYAQARIGAAAVGAVAEKPETSGTMLVFLALPETILILGFIMATMILLMLR